MEAAIKVAFVGFNPFERNTLEAFFRLASRRQTRYVVSADTAAADVLLVDGDQRASLQQARDRANRCLVIGNTGLPGQLGQVPRPINMMTMLRTLDAAVPSLGAAADGAGHPTVDVVLPPAPPAAPAQPAEPAARAAATPKVEVPLPDRLRAAAPAATADAGAATSHILVVDDSEVALQFMANCLGRFGFQVHLATSGEEALQRVASRDFDYVFMDVSMPGIDGYQTCKLIKNRPYPAGRRPPSVAMLTSRGGMVDKLRGTLAGCDAYLTKPLQQEALLKVIGDRIVQTADEDTSTSLAL